MSKTGEWLSLSDVAQLLGVHPSTVRSWSDQGHLPVHRTQGGHRRYRRSEVELWIQSRQSDGTTDGNLVVQNALRNTRLQISEGRLESEGWYQKMDEEARIQYRRSGRALLQGLLAYLAGEETVDWAEARSLGYEYASRGWRNGLTAAEATRALLFFRSVLLESMLTVYSAASVYSPSAWSDMFTRITEFTDQIQLTLLETYEAYQRGSR
jgi:excisionase family DNA binding protein